MDSLAYFLLPETWQRFLSHSWATFGLREEAVETLSMAWRWSSVSLDLYLDLLKFKVEKSFSHKYVLPKRHMVRLNNRESSGKLGFNSRKNCQSSANQGSARARPIRARPELGQSGLGPSSANQGSARARPIRAQPELGQSGLSQLQAKIVRVPARISMISKYYDDITQFRGKLLSLQSNLS